MDFYQALGFALHVREVTGCDAWAVEFSDGWRVMVRFGEVEHTVTSV